MIPKWRYASLAPQKSSFCTFTCDEALYSVDLEIWPSVPPVKDGPDIDTNESNM